jgi:hypothetical protein
VGPGKNSPQPVHLIWTAPGRIDDRGAAAFAGRIRAGLEHVGDPYASALAVLAQAEAMRQMLE